MNLQNQGDYYTSRRLQSQKSVRVDAKNLKSLEDFDL